MTPRRWRRSASRSSPTRVRGGGPVAGILDALSRTDDDILVSACDLPWLDAGTVKHLIEVAATRPDADVVVAHDPDGPHLAGVWRPRSVSGWKAWSRAGCGRYRGALERLDTVCVDVPSSVVANVNSPDDLRRRR